jgi:hypothetical protein
MKRLIVVDRQVPQWQDLLRGIAPAVEVVVLPPDADGVVTIALLDDRLADLDTLIAGMPSSLAVQTLDHGGDRLVNVLSAWGQLPELKTLHLMAHGSPGALYLGQDGLNLENVELVATVLRQVAPNLQTIALWGCHVAAGDAGAELLDRLHQLTGANVAASGNQLGAGAWILESQRGFPEVAVPINQATQRNYAGTFPCSYDMSTHTEVCTPDAGGAGASTPPPEIGRIYVTNPLAGNAVIEDGTNPGPTIADPDGTDGRYSQRFNVVNQTGVSVTLSQFSIQFSETPPGSDVTAYRLEILDDSGVPQPLTSLSLNPRQTSPIQISLKSTTPDGTLIPPGKYIANFVISTSGEPTVYNFPVSWTIPDPTVPGIGNGDGANLGDAPQILSSQNAIAASITANFADQNGEVPPAIAQLTSPNASPGGFSLTARPDLLGANPPVLIPAQVDPNDSLLKAATTDPIASLLDNSAGALGTVIQDGERTEEGSPTVGEQFIDILQDAGTTAATTDVVGSQVVLTSIPTSTTTSSQVTFVGPEGNNILDISKRVTGTTATLAIGANDGTSTANGTGPVRTDGSVDFSNGSEAANRFDLGLAPGGDTEESAADVNGAFTAAALPAVGSPTNTIQILPDGTLQSTWPSPVTGQSTRLDIYQDETGMPVLAAEGTDPNQEAVYGFKRIAPNSSATLEERFWRIDEEMARSLTDENANIVKANDQSGKLFGQDGDDVLYGGPNITELNGNGGKDVIDACGSDSIRPGNSEFPSINDPLADVPQSWPSFSDISIPEDGDLSAIDLELLPLVLRGGEDDDILLGCTGNEVLFGDDGNDQLTGNAGADGFVLGRNRGTDLITDFTPEVDGFYLETVRTDKNTGTEYAALTLDELVLTDRRGPVQVDAQTLTDVAYVEIAIAATNEVIARVLNGERGLSSAQLGGRFAPLPNFLAPIPPTLGTEIIDFNTDFAIDPNTPGLDIISA